MLPANFEDKYFIEPNSGCWLWAGALGAGYGRVRVGAKLCGAHRLSYKHYIGEIADDTDVCHKCDTRACVNPMHLFAGTAKENASDAVNKGRIAHKLKRSVVREIFAAKGSQQEISDRYGVAQSTISRIRARKIWKPLLEGVG